MENVGVGAVAVNHAPDWTLLTSGMDLLTIIGAIMLVFWAAGTFAFEAPGIIHLFLSLGVMLIVLGAVKRAERARKSKG